MKILHQLGHNCNWGLDTHFDNEIGDGFIFTAYSFDCAKMGQTISRRKSADYLPLSMIDLQFYGNKNSTGGKLATYPFHPINNRRDKTSVGGIEKIQAAVTYQQRLGFKKIIIPFFYLEEQNLNKTIKLISRINKNVRLTHGYEYYMTIPFANESIKNEEYVELLLQAITDINIEFDGYYIVCDSNPGYKKKVSVDFNYYTNLLKVFATLNKQGFKTIHGYANWDAIVFNALTNIDFVSIGTFENLRNFNITRFTEKISGGPSDGWYYSEKLMNFIKAKDLTQFRNTGTLDMIRNDRNAFSDIILDESFAWSTQKPDVHKNYLLAISRFYERMRAQKDIKKRASYVLEKVYKARELYERLATDHKVFLMDESSDYHLDTWAAFIQRNILM